MSPTTQHALMTGIALFGAAMLHKGIQALIRWSSKLGSKNPLRWLSRELWKG